MDYDGDWYFISLHYLLERRFIWEGKGLMTTLFLLVCGQITIGLGLIQLNMVIWFEDMKKWPMFNYVIRVQLL